MFIKEYTRDNYYINSIKGQMQRGNFKKQLIKTFVKARQLKGFNKEQSLLLCSCYYFFTNNGEKKADYRKLSILPYYDDTLSAINLDMHSFLNFMSQKYYREHFYNNYIRYQFNIISFTPREENTGESTDVYLELLIYN